MTLTKCPKCKAMTDEEYSAALYAYFNQNEEYTL